MNQNKNKYTNHIPVLLNEVISVLDPKSGNTYLDLTAGYGGHCDAVLSFTTNPGGMVLVDRDNQAIRFLQNKYGKSKVLIVHNDFLTASKDLLKSNYRFDLILADLGVSSLHFNEASRGFSLLRDGPLDMRMNQDQDLTAEKVINTYSREELVCILKEYGEEPRARLIADIIVNNRPFNSTLQLSNLIAGRFKNSRIHPATKTFQAIRIEVNNELNLLSDSLDLWLKLLSVGGRIAIISFHSLEDRIVKNFFKDHSSSKYEAELNLINKHPITAGPQEIVNNPRARSAKLRAAVKIKI